MTERNLIVDMKRYAESLVEQGWTFEQAELEAYDLFIGADERHPERYESTEDDSNE